VVNTRCVEIRIEPTDKPAADQVSERTAGGSQSDRPAPRPGERTDYDRRHHVSGAISWAVTRDDGVSGCENYRYEHRLATDGVTILGPGWEYSDGTGSSLGCADSVTVGYHHDAIVLGQSLYPSVAACRQAITAARDRAAWLPLPIADEVAAGSASPSLGGC
jgi:hypothetical protein